MSKENVINMAEQGPVQISVRLDPDLRDGLKIMSIKRKIKFNDLLVEYLSEGLKKDKKEE